MKNIFPTKIALGLCLIAFSCQSSATQEETASQEKSAEMTGSEAKTNGKYEMEITLEGKTYTFESLDRQSCVIEEENGKIHVRLYNNDRSIEFNMYLMDMGVWDEGSASYTLPEDNEAKTMIELNFFVYERESSRSNKRVLFRKGEVNISEITKNSLTMTFSGEGNGMLESSKEQFPISGSVQITL